MRRLEYSLTTRLIYLMALAALAGCAAPAQSVSNQLYPAPALGATGTAQPLIGSTPTTLSAEFGQPVLLRVEGPAQVWLYHSSSCGLNLILYPDAAGTPRVTNVSATDDGDTAGSNPNDCTASLQQAHLDAAISPALAALEHPASS